MGEAMRLTVVFLLLFLFSTESPAETRSEAIDNAIEESLKTYRERAIEGDQLGMAQAAAERTKKLKELMDEVNVQELDTYSLKELVSFTAAYEYLLKRESSIICGMAAVKKDPTNESSYLPLIRCLLNNRNLLDAEDVLKIGLEKANQKRPLQASRLLFHSVYFGVGDYANALRHIEEAMFFFISQIPEDHRVARVSVQLMEKYATTLY